MSKRRQPNEVVRRKPGSCFIGASEPSIVRLSGPEDGDLHDIAPCLMGCDDRECLEWANAQIVRGPHAGEWVFHLAECQMDDEPQEAERD